jgi:GTPase-associated protein 1, N-terminal domain type 2
VLIEQAIFTSAQTDRAEGYQLAGRSAGLSTEDARELAVWGPSHDSLLEQSGEPASTNFHRLSSGAYCVSRTTLVGAEYSGRGGAQVYTQFLVVPPPLLARFSNNPFAILRAATASGALAVGRQIPEVLEPFRLSGRAAAVDLELLAQLGRNPGPAAMATFVQTALACDRLAVAAGSQAEQWFAGLISLLPIECRVEFSFATGLKHSPNRAVRISALPGDPSSWRAIARQGITLLDLGTADLSDNRWEGWAGCVAQILASGKLSLLAAQLEQPRPGLNCASLHQLSEQIQSKLPTGPVRSTGTGNSPRPTAPKTVAVESGSANQRADAAHIRTERAVVAAKSARKGSLEGLAEALAAQPPAVLELLERIDDLVFAAIAGDDGALAELEVLWPIVVDELDDDLVEQSREQYLRCALSIWTECVDDDLRSSRRAMSAIDVICVLFDT